MSSYISFSVTVRGSSHVDAGTVCEDSSAHFDDGTIHIAAVADGHGDPACFRSGTGAGMAAETAVEQLRSFAETLPESETELLFRPRSFRALTRHLAFNLIGTWRERVLAHFDSNPPTQEELAASGQSKKSRLVGMDIDHAYGTTLIACLITEKYMLALQQGDGRCVVIRQSGKIDQPVPWDSRCAGRCTTSLCNDDAVDACRFYVSDQRTDPVVAVYVLTDGVEDSYRTMDGVSAFCGKLTSRCVENGVESLSAQLEQELSDFSRRGSRDDVSVAAILDTAAAAAHLESFRLRTDLVIGEKQAYQAKVRMDSMFLKKRYLAADLDKAKERYEKLKQEIHCLFQSIKEMSINLQESRAQHHILLQDLQEKDEALQAAQKAYEDYSAEYEQAETEKQKGETLQRNARERLRQMGLDDQQKLQRPE